MPCLCLYILNVSIKRKLARLKVKHHNQNNKRSMEILAHHDSVKSATPYDQSDNTTE